MLLVGLILLAIGTAVLSGAAFSDSQAVYPFLWWGLVLILDSINSWKWKESPIRGRIKNFLGVTLPLSAIYWLYFEFINFAYPQWQYVGIVEGTVLRVFLTFISFATVIPAVTEIFWLFHGPVKTGNKSRFSPWFSLIGLVMAVAPFFSDIFILNQLVWIAPFFIILPFLSHDLFNIRFWSWTVISGLITGFIWEFLNFWAGGKWIYTILPDAFRIFEMPVYGYLGFIPFAASTAAVYFLSQKFAPKLWVIAALYIVAIGLSYVFVINLNI